MLWVFRLASIVCAATEGSQFRLDIRRKCSKIEKDITFVFHPETLVAAVLQFCL